MVSTKDNPFSPFTQFNEWAAFDQRRGYHTLSLLARVAHSSSDLPLSFQESEIDKAVDQIVSTNVTGLYVKVYREDFEKFE